MNKHKGKPPGPAVALCAFQQISLYDAAESRLYLKKKKKTVHYILSRRVGLE